jgi:hypothetical protein
MAVLTLPKQSRVAVVICLIGQAVALYAVANHSYRNLLACVIAFFVGGYITDTISGMFHFSFDYVWPARFPIMGPVAVDFRGHHLKPGLDPSALTANITRGAYGALPLAIATWAVARYADPTWLAFLIAATLMSTSIWMLGFHQIHSYTHMGSKLPAAEFNKAVLEINQLPTRREQKEAFVKLFRELGIPRYVRVLQRCRLFLRPEVHWRHHINFETDFSSVNGWSDPVMNLIYRPIARWRKVKGLPDSHRTAHELDLLRDSSLMEG